VVFRLTTAFTATFGFAAASALVINCAENGRLCSVSFGVPSRPLTMTPRLWMRPKGSRSYLHSRHDRLLQTRSTSVPSDGEAQILGLDEAAYGLMISRASGSVISDAIVYVVDDIGMGIAPLGAPLVSSAPNRSNIFPIRPEKTLALTATSNSSRLSASRDRSRRRRSRGRLRLPAMLSSRVIDTAT